MRDEVMKKYLKMVPEELREMVSGLSDDKHWALYIALLENEKMTFGELRGEFSEHQQTLSNMLKDLANAGLVIKKADRLKDMADKTKSFYTPTDAGEMFIESLMDNMLLPEKNKKPCYEKMKSTGIIYKDICLKQDSSKTSEPGENMLSGYSSTDGIKT